MRRLAIAAVAIAVLGTAVAPALGARTRQGPAPETTSDHVAWNLDLRLPVGTESTLSQVSSDCADDIENLDTTVTQKTNPQVFNFGFNATAGIFDGCFQRPSYVHYQLNVTKPFTGSLRLSFNETAAGGTWNTRCERDTETANLFCHKNAQYSLIVGKVN